MRKNLKQIPNILKTPKKPGISFENTRFSEFSKISKKFEIFSQRNFQIFQIFEIQISKIFIRNFSELLVE